MNRLKADFLIKNIHLATVNPAIQTPYGTIESGAILVKNGNILWVGEERDLPAIDPSTQIIDGHSGWVTPGLIDCHTHLVFGGNRAREFEWRLQGESYESIARRGGGIVSTVQATRAASEESLFKQSAQRLQALLNEGVTTVEIKSGYGLDLSTEIKMLRVAQALADKYPVHISNTYLGAHALPAEYNGQPDDYINAIVNQYMPAIAEQNLTDAVDVFCEGIGFSVAQCRKVFEKATELGLRVKAHAEQLSYLGGARLVAEYKGLSVDHVEYLPESDLPLLKQNQVVPVLLPGAYYYLKETRMPPIQALRSHQLPMAIASDLNPGSSPLASLRLMMNLACVLFGLTPEEAMTGVTRHAAAALGLAQRKGQLTAGFDADFILWDMEHPAQLSYSINTPCPQTVWVNGKPIRETPVGNTSVRSTPAQDNLGNTDQKAGGGHVASR